MSGHSKWATTKHKKEAADKKRGVVFTKLGNAITVAARQGGSDPEMNFSLRLAIDRAKQANMPKENIERAIKRGTGESGGTALEEVTYEGFLSIRQVGGPGKIAIVIFCLTDNKNRTVSEIKHILEKNGGSLAGQGAVMWMFSKMGVIEMEEFGNKAIRDYGKIELEEFELKLIDAGADDVEIDDDKILIYTKPEDLQKVKENLEHENITLESAEIKLVAHEKVEVSDEEKEKIQKPLQELEEQLEVSGYYTNIK